MMKKKFIFIFILFSVVSILPSFKKQTSRQKALKTIIVDAGHGIRPNGGFDGAHGSYSYEDEICFDVSLELVKLLQEQLPDVNIVQTRTSKNIVPLHERANIANRNNGDLFISIHVNAAPPIQHREFLRYKTVISYVGKGKKRRKVTRKVPQYHYYTTPNLSQGTETYIWGSHKNDDKEIAVRENAPMLAEENYEENYGKIDVESPEFIALALVKTKQFFKRSAALASFVEVEFNKVGRISRGERQRQKGIWVLQATAMPSVLVETGYITNHEEEDYLNSKDGQHEIALCVTNAIKTYKDWLEKQQQQGIENSNTEKREPSANANNTKAFLEMVDKKEKSRGN